MSYVRSLGAENDPQDILECGEPKLALMNLTLSTAQSPQLCMVIEDGITTEINIASPVGKQ